MSQIHTPDATTKTELCPVCRQQRRQLVERQGGSLACAPCWRSEDAAERRAMRAEGRMR